MVHCTYCTIVLMVLLLLRLYFHTIVQYSIVILEVKPV